MSQWPPCCTPICGELFRVSRNTALAAPASNIGLSSIYIQVVDMLQSITM